MFLFGDQIINDYNFKFLLQHLISIKAVRGRDYQYFDKEQIILKPTQVIISSPLCYRYQNLSINKLHSKIGRHIDYKNKVVTDYVFDSLGKDSFDSNVGPYTLGWTYDYNYTSVIDSVMELVESIPKEKRNDPFFVISYICSRIDSCNDSKNGIIEGRWKSTFTGGKQPFEWKSSSNVFREKIRLGHPVKYGQCWVLADILTGILNFLGLRSRSIEIRNCVMDLYLTGGFDSVHSTSEFFIKADGSSIDPRKDHIDPFHYECPIITSEEKEIYKGPVFDLENTTMVDSRDFYNLNHIIENNLGKSWNFHVWTECKIGNEWYILDPSPLHDVDEASFLPYLDDRGYELLNNKKFFGPISVRCIKENITPRFLKNNFKYLYSCINGQFRTWCPLVQNCKLLLYLNKVSYFYPEVYQKTFLGKTLKVTSRYRDTYDGVHKENPIFFMIKNNDLTKLYLSIKEHKISRYVIQISFFYGNTPLYIHREQMIEINPSKLSFLKQSNLKKYRSHADRFTVSIYDINSNLFWTQCVQI